VVAIDVPGRGVVIVLLIAGACVQLVGILTVIVQLAGSRREAAPLRPSTDDLQLGEPVTTYLQSQMQAGVLYRSLSGSRWQVVGVIMLSVGLAAQTLAGVLALFLAPSG
jgi:hypothetical protein